MIEEMLRNYYISVAWILKHSYYSILRHLNKVILLQQELLFY